MFVDHKFTFITLCLFITTISAYIVEPGPKVIATKGEVWPKPQSQTSLEDYFIIRPSTFTFETTYPGCQQFFQNAFSRYWNIISNAGRLEGRGRFAEARRRPQKTSHPKDKAYIGDLDVLNVDLTGECSGDDIRPDFGMVENYTLTISTTEALLQSETVWGVLRGLETFTQLIYMEEDTLRINLTQIVDFPRFPHRGVLLDTSRHFIPLYSIYNLLDGLSYDKYNVFHWHIVDDHSFPYRSRNYPELSEMGAYHPISKVYEQLDVQNVIEYARWRGIRVIPEFDTPGHTRSWGVAHPELLVACYNGSEPTGQLGPMDPTKETTYQLLETLFTEVFEVFPDSYFHIGGDEVGFECWQSNPDINAYMAANNISSYVDLESMFIQRVVQIVESLNAKYFVWEEVFTNGVQIPNNTIVHVWIEDDGLQTLANATAAGKYGLYSACWYLDHLQNGGDWIKYYNCDPLDFFGTLEQKALVLGGESCMWSEVVDEHNVASRVWPRASAAAERLWSDESVRDVTDAEKRLEEHYCRLNTRGVGAQPPNGPGVCL